MDAEGSGRLREIVADTLERPVDGRAGFLARACGGDAALLAEARSLLDQEAGAREFLERPGFLLAGEGGSLDDPPAAGELRPGEQLGECRIVALLGEGGMGEVYLAEDTRLGRPVAVKLLKRRLLGSGESLARRFEHERRVLAALNHPNIARLYGAATTAQGRAFLVMEYVEGEPLDRFCERRGLGVAARLALFGKVCAAVAYAHQNLVVHRDLKPANIRVTPEGEPKLLDFGIAKLLEAENTVGPAGADPTVTLLGAMTPEYASPEQIKGEPITTASDVYSLGVMLYELLSGQRPYRLQGRRPDEVARAVCEEEPPRPSTAVARGTATRPADTKEAALVCGEPPARLQRRLAGDLDNIVAKALRKESARRYASVAALAEDLRRHTEGLPVRARRDTFGYRTAKFVRRNRVLVAAASLVLLALVGGLVATSWQVRVARTERDRARHAQAEAERARRQSDHLNGFLQTLLGSINPEETPNRDLKVVQVLDTATRNLDAQLANEPALRAQAHTTLGRAYGGLREAEPAVQHLREALKLDQSIYGDDSLVTARDKTNLARGLSGLLRQDGEAEPLLRQALAVQRKQPAQAREDLLMSLQLLSYIKTTPGSMDEAVALTDEYLAWVRRAGAGDTGLYADALMRLGHLRLNQGDFAGAEAPYRQAVEIQRRVSPGGPNHAAKLTSLAYALVLQGRYDEPEKLLLEARETYRRTVGEQSVPYFFTVGTLGWLHYLRGDFAPAEEELHGAMVFMRPRCPPNDQEVMGGMITLALTLTERGRPAEAEPLLHECQAQGKTTRLVGMAAPGCVEAALGQCLLAQGRHPEAERPLLDGYAACRDNLGTQHPLTVRTARRLHELYTFWNRPAQAETYAAAVNPTRKDR